MNRVCVHACGRRFDYLVRMRVAIFRTPDVNAEGFAQLMNALRELPGPIQFEAPAEGAEESEVGGWGTLPSAQGILWEDAFAKMSSLRREHDLPDDAGLILLTETPNDYNYFAFAEPAGSGPGNHCLHTGDWEEYTGSNFVYPTLHIIASNLLQGWMYSSMEEWMANAHEDAKGCVSDFCGEKLEILKRLRTADICQDCLNRFSAAIAEGKLKPGYFHQCMDLLELARKDLLFHKRISAVPARSAIEVIGPKMDLWLPEFRRSIKMQATPKALYLLYLRHPEGIPYESLDEYRQELMDNYNAVKGDKTAGQLQEHFDRLLNIADLSSLRQQISRMRGAVLGAVGEELLGEYMWDSSRDAAKRIPIASESGMVRWPNEQA